MADLGLHLIDIAGEDRVEGRTMAHHPKFMYPTVLIKCIDERAGILAASAFLEIVS